MFPDNLVMLLIQLLQNPLIISNQAMTPNDLRALRKIDPEMAGMMEDLIQTVDGIERILNEEKIIVTVPVFATNSTVH